MLVIGLIRENKVPRDSRVALTPSQCKWLQKHFHEIKLIVQSSETRCFNDSEYRQAGIPVQEDMRECDLLLGIKEVPFKFLLEDKTYLFFSHTHKEQPHNAEMLQQILARNITLVDYECLVHEDGQRIIGFGFFAGIVGAHNGIMAYGKRTGLFDLGRVYQRKDYRELIHTYFGLKLPNIKIAVTGSGRVAHGILDIMNLMDVKEVEPSDFLKREFDYAVYVNLKGADLYVHKAGNPYEREHFHSHAHEYDSRFKPYCSKTDILMNGVYWDHSIPQLFTMDTLMQPGFRIQTIADVTDDALGSIPCNIGDASFEDPVYGVDKKTGKRTAPYLETSVDMMAVGNLPNELPRDASRYFGEQLIKYVLDDIRKGGSPVIQKATIVNKGSLTDRFAYLKNYVGQA
ncbi:alanine dehydrogenase [Segetibacter sp. 3557_3]|uniref:NAD(P)-dependent oxidoreductase n=1 Tax=Segetibacter sp. 3557_3 TaxID=2547429 RepID=UPI001058A24C|nr:NAD(P)-dependent oxidoreductase [Segetibacter sp. 3557_3]TDH27244.1 alanine dehydrogenase [Segetibacter sp. 3557_3]